MKKNFLTIAIFFISVIHVHGESTSLMPEELVKTCLCLEVAQEASKDLKKSKQYVIVGSCLLVSKSDHFFLLTAKHIIEKTRDSELFIKIPSKEGCFSHRSTKDIISQTGVDWVVSDKNDIALLPISVNINNDDILFINIDDPQYLVQYKDLRVGEDLFVIGYPSSVTSQIKFDSHIVRNGIVAAILNSNRFLIDSFIFPGNSGGPVFLKGKQSFKIGESAKDTFFTTEPVRFIGIVVSYVPYEDIAISIQTNKPRVSFQENSGLSVIESVSGYLELLDSDTIKNYLINK